MTDIHKQVYGRGLRDTYVAVPKHLLEELEEARKLLYAMHSSECDPIPTAKLSKLVQITEPMWRLANTKWKEVKS